MSRNDDTFKENPAGVSSMLFYHATIIIHGEAKKIFATLTEFSNSF